MLAAFDIGRRAAPPAIRGLLSAFLSATATSRIELQRKSTRVNQMQVGCAKDRVGCGGIRTSHEHHPDMTRTTFIRRHLRNSLPALVAIIIGLGCSSPAFGAPNTMVAAIDDRQN